MDAFSPSFFQVAFIYVFNLIIGVGALTMPKAFANAGWLIASVLIGILCLMRLVEDYRYHSNYYYYYYHYHYYGVIITALIIVCFILVLQYSPIHSPYISYYKTLKVIAHIKIKLPHDEADYFQLMLQNDTWYSDCSPLWSWAKQVALPKIIASNQGMYSISVVSWYAISGYSNVVCLSLFIYWHVSWLPTSVEASAEHGLTIYWPNISFWLYQSTSKMDFINIDWMNQWEVSVMLSIQSSCYAIFYCVCANLLQNI